MQPETARLWIGTFAEPTAIVVFGLILVTRLGALRHELVNVVREEFGKIEHAINNASNQITLVVRELAYRNGR